MLRAIGSEFEKVFTTRMWWLLALLLVGYVAFLAGGFGAFLGWATENPDAAANAGNTQLPPGLNLAPLLYSFASSIGYVFPVLLGALAVTSEFRHKTLTPTFLAEPHRSVVLGAKFASRAHRGRGTRRGRLRDLGRHRRRRARGVRPRHRASARATPGRSSDAACWRWRSGRRSASASARSCRTRWRPSSSCIAFTQFVEPILRLAASLNDVTANIGQFLPGAASDALVGASFYSIASVGAAESLEWWQGGLVLLAIGVVATLIGGATTWRRDVQ